ncbi:putative UDP-glucuronosyl/UDP-glucosyltransferase, UDP-glycosyltransferase family [Helianthus debilis subsp. tardiflorus]
MQKVRLRDLPEHLLATKLDDPSFNWYVDSARRADKVPHVIIHTFNELEAPLIKEIKSIFPHTYTVGPLQLLVNQITENETKKTNFNGYSLWKEEPECVQWLHSKEPNSVVYVNFGSITVMSFENLVEFGWGLVNSNHNFLWIIRTDLVDGKPVTLPQELEEEIKRRGFIASWCSQEEVLNHPSVGGFLTHGGWGSVIESLTAGVPMVCWPFSYDQNVNCRQLCKEWEVGMMIEGDVKRDEVEKIVRELMEGVEGNRMRKNAMDFKKKAEIATAPNGSSSLNIEELVNAITNLS